VLQIILLHNFVNQHSCAFTLYDQTACLPATRAAAHICGATLSFLCMHAGPLLAKGLGDANAACQDGALEAMLAYLAAGDEAQAAR